MFDRRVAVAIAIVVAIALSVVVVTLTSQKRFVEAQCFGELVLQPNLLAPFGIKAYISEEALKHINISVFKLLGIEVSQFSFPNVSRIEDKSIIVFHVDDFKNSKPVEALTKLVGATANASRFILMVLNTARDTNATETALNVVLKLYGSRNIIPVLPLDPESIGSDKLDAPMIHRALYSAEALVFTFNPVGVIVVESLKDLPQTLVMVAKWSGLIPHGALPSAVVGGQSIFPGSAWKFIGYIGWITANTIGSVCGETTGTVYVKVDYYYASVTTPGGKTYHGFMAHVEHSAKGYRTQCCTQSCVLGFCSTSCSTNDHYPQIFISKTNWMTSIYPGQVLDDWGPKGVGTSSTISFSVAWSAAGVSATVQYNTSTSLPNAPYYEWYDMTDPAAGIAMAKHVVRVPQGYNISNLNGVIFSVGPVSIAFLDPDRPGGTLPMYISHEFATTLNTGDTATISFGTKLYPTTVIKQ